jgi:YidC/Oxa1 family membrane protein insertase
MNFGPIVLLVDKVMIPFLEFSYNSIIPNYGFAIILLTIIIKLLFFPLMNKQYASMKAMQAISPQMKIVREKYKKDPKKMQAEMLKLYSEHKVNPMSGCLPMIVQIPFFLAIYSTILSDSFTALIMAPGANKGLFSFWISDLSVPDGSYILPIALAVFTFYSQKMMMVDPKQKQFMYLSPILILVFGFKLPAGVLLYWAVSTALSTVQQVYVNKGTNGPVSDVIDVKVKEKKASKKTPKSLEKGKDTKKGAAKKEPTKKGSDKKEVAKKKVAKKVEKKATKSTASKTKK